MLVDKMKCDAVQCIMKDNSGDEDDVVLYEEDYNFLSSDTDTLGQVGIIQKSEVPLNDSLKDDSYVASE